jgi:hypothetical protein
MWKEAEMNTQALGAVRVLTGIALLFTDLAAHGHPFRAQQTDATTPREHAERSMELNLAGPVEKVFPLFGPVEESRWAPNWKPNMLFPPSGAPAGAGSVFTVGDDVWAMTVYDPSAHAIHYVVVTPGHSVGEIDIRVVAAGPDKSQATVVFRHTALSAQGDEEIRAFVQHFPNQAPHWENAINRYLSAAKP